MKNIHVLPTSQVLFNSVIRHTDNSKLQLVTNPSFNENDAKFLIKDTKWKPVNIYITNDEEIKEGDWVVEIITTSRNPYIGKTFYPKNDGTVTEEALRKYLLSVNYKDHYETIAHKGNCSKIILTTDQNLINDGIEQISEDTLLKIVEHINSGKNIESFDEL